MEHHVQGFHAWRAICSKALNMLGFVNSNFEQKASKNRTPFWGLASVWIEYNFVRCLKFTLNSDWLVPVLHGFMCSPAARESVPPSGRRPGSVRTWLSVIFGTSIVSRQTWTYDKETGVWAERGTSSESWTCPPLCFWLVSKYFKAAHRLSATGSSLIPGDQWELKASVISIHWQNGEQDMLFRTAIWC